MRTKLFQVLINVASIACIVVPAHEFQGNPLGLMDSQGKEVIPAHYSEIRYLSSGYYLTRSVEPGLKPGKQLTLFNRIGKEIAVSVPTGSFFAGVYSIGTKNDGSDRNNVLDALPDQSLLIFSKDGRLGLCDKKGHIALPAQFGAIDMVNGGTPFIFENSVIGLRNPYISETPSKNGDTKIYTFSKAGGLKELGNQSIYYISPEYSEGRRIFGIGEERFGFLDEQGKVCIEPRFKFVRDFRNGIARVWDVRQGNQAIDKSGKTVPTESAFAAQGAQKVRAFNSGNLGSCLLSGNRAFFQRGRIYPRRDGTFIVVGEKATVLTSQAPGCVTTAPYIEKDAHVLLRCIPKSEYNASTKYKTPATSLPTEQAFNSGYNIHVAADGLDTVGTPYSTRDFDDPMIPFANTPAGLLSENVDWTQSEKDRFIMQEPFGSRAFDRVAWHRGGSRVTRVELFSRLLHEHNLIGMSRDKITDLLGEGLNESNEIDRLSFELCSSKCEPPSLSIQFNFANQRVVSWRFSGSDGYSSTFTEDVVMVPELGRKSTPPLSATRAILEDIEQSMSTGNWQKARIQCERAVGGIDDCATLWMRLGTCYQVTDDFQKSISAYQKAYDLDPKEQKVTLFYMAVVHEKLHQDSLAYDKYLKYLQVDPNGKYSDTAKEKLREYNRQ